VFRWRRRRDRDRELDEEIRSHLEMARQDREDRGASPRDAAWTAARELGNEALIKELTRESWGGARWERLWQDARIGLRLLRRNPGFAAAAVLTLALGLGSAVAMFSVVDAVLLKPLPFREPERLVRVWEAKDPGDRNVANGWNVLDWRERSHSLSALAAIQATGVNLAGAGDPVAVPALAVQGEFFSILGVPPLLGRVLGPEDVAAGKDHVVVLSYGLWQRRFGGDPGVFGRKVQLNGTAFDIVGVMPAGFSFPGSAAELWAPLRITRDEGWGGGRSLTTVGRLDPRHSLAQAREELAAVARVIAEERPAMNKGWTTNVVPLMEDVTREVQRPLLVLLAGVGFLLLVSCANVANLLLMRGAGRQREMAVRSALGAGRGRIAQQLLAESLLLSLVSAALGALAAHAGLRALVAVLPESVQLPRADTIRIDVRALAVAVALAFATALVTGLAPALQSARRDLQAALRTGTLRTGVSAGRRLRAAFVAAQIALALVLLTGAGLVIRSFRQLAAVDPGFQADRVLSLRLPLNRPQFRDADRRAQYLSRILDEVRAAPGVRAASSVHFLPLSGDTSASCLVRGMALPEMLSEAPVSEMLVVSPGYFETLGTPVMAGRDFDASDARSGRSVVVVNRAFAERYFPGEDPLGGQLALCWSVTNPVEIVGVVANARQTQLRKAPVPTVFIPNAQSPMYFASLVVRAAEDPRQIAGAVRAAVARVDPEQGISAVRTMSEVFQSAVAEPRFQLVLLTAFAGLALFLSAVGVYAVVTYAVAQRLPEIAVRIALGAGRPQVVRLVLRDGFLLVGLGVAAGLGLALALTRLLRSILFQVAPTDPMTYVAVCALLAAVTFVACALPARRATRTDPMVALRAD
jgi:predicted permease